MTTQTKITEDDVRAMRKRYEAGEGPAQLGEAFGISKAAAWRIVTYRSWTQVAPEPTPEVEVLDVEADATYEVEVEVRYEAPPEEVSEGLLDEVNELEAKRAAKREYMREWRRKQGAKEKPGPERSAPCGTRSGYKAHLKHGEPTCAPCRKAHVDWQKANRARRNLQKTG